MDNAETADGTAQTVQTTDSVWQTTVPTVETTEPTAQTTEPTAQTTEPIAQAMEPTAQTTEITIQLNDSTDQTTEPTVQTTELTVPLTEPTGQTTEPTVQTTEPAFQLTEPTGQTTEPTVQTTEITVQQTAHTANGNEMKQDDVAIVQTTPVVNAASIDGAHVVVTQPVGLTAPILPENQVDDYLTPAILVTVFCCLILGVIGIVKALESRSARNRGDIEGAQRASKAARMFSLIGLACGVVTMLIVVISALA